MQHLDLENAALRDWPALEQIDYDGWLLRFAAGFTRRANSVNPLAHLSLPLQQKISHCEALYTARGLTPVFRLTPYSLPENLDGVLAQRGYTHVEPSLVMWRSLPVTDLPPADAAPLRLLSLDEWCSAFAHLSDSSPATRPTHRAILDRIRGSHFCATLDAAELPVACGRGVLEHNLLGLFDLITAPSHRSQGNATRLVAALLRQAHAAGAQHAYLQVAASNHAARRLYARLVFQGAYPYWYRVAPSSLYLHA